LLVVTLALPLLPDAVSTMVHHLVNDAAGVVKAFN
jgi:hypothetical protein